jgi:hypothetical protein
MFSFFPLCRNIIIDKLFLNLRNLKVDVLICLKTDIFVVQKIKCNDKYQI